MRVNVNSIARRQHFCTNASEVVCNSITFSWQVRKGVSRELKECCLLDVDKVLLHSSIA